MSAGRAGPDDLLAAWTGAFGPIATAVGRDLLERYAEPHRRYHDTAHLRAVLQTLRRLHPAGELPIAVLAAAFWHDAVYDPTAADNEPRSADLAAEALTGLGWEPALVTEVRRLVLLTAHHAPAPDDELGALLCDADLAVLASGADVYARYAAGVRAEYAHLGDEGFRAGRAAVLLRLLARPRLFTTGPGRRLWEVAARRNVAAELALLSAPSVAADPPA